MRHREIGDLGDQHIAPYPNVSAHLATGIVAQVATITLATCAAVLVLVRRDPAA
ncbi:hypothetical protein [Streptomyces sp. CoH27]|uniref:hypothetical protein n=1 Tax=Streptomyces sp. CoH27 TaxID=2875763 RepID=UPI001CD2DA88|nr:hypothetical protein [Streptomyces sp. CoH27]